MPEQSPEVGEAPPSAAVGQRIWHPIPPWRLKCHKPVPAPSWLLTVMLGSPFSPRSPWVPGLPYRQAEGRWDAGPPGAYLPGARHSLTHLLSSLTRDAGHAAGPRH